MGKVIVFCADGTWNGPGEPDSDNTESPPTNVFKLFLNLDGENQQDGQGGQAKPVAATLRQEQERVLTGADGAVLQHAKYLHGVGDSDNLLVQLLGGALGVGLITRIVRGYTFISRTYVPGDRIVILGFSRGAYTARALAGMIAAKGLLDAAKVQLDQRETAYKLGAAVWYAYRQQAARAQPDWLVRLTSFVVDRPGFVRQPVPDALLLHAPIEAVAVWDTVGALGIPTYALDAHRLDFFQFADRVLSPIVAHGLHAVAVDERRSDFTPTLWEPDGRILQALFPGSHSDVGGGYPGPGPECGLSDATLAWMTERLAALGVCFRKTPAYAPRPDSRATAHAPWRHGVWMGLTQEPRAFPAGLYVAEEVADRAGAPACVPDPGLPACPYDPANLPGYLVGGVIAQGATMV